MFSQLQAELALCIGNVFRVTRERKPFPSRYVIVNDKPYNERCIECIEATGLNLSRARKAELIIKEEKKALMSRPTVSNSLVHFGSTRHFICSGSTSFC